MLKKTIKYKDYNGIDRTEDFYFNLTKAELIEMDLGTSGGLTEMFNRIVSAQDAPAIIDTFKKLVLKAYGEKSPDGKFFLKEDSEGRSLANKFKQTEAYSELFMELASDSKAAAEFFNGIIPPIPEDHKPALKQVEK